jgi:DNA-binding CsgD family transcriptional regulator
MAIIRYKTEELGIIHNTNKILPANAFEKYIFSDDLLMLHLQTSKSFYYFVDFTCFKFQHISSSIKNILGYSPDEILNNDPDLFFKYYHPDSALTIKAIHNEAITFINSFSKKTKSKITVSYNIKLRRKDGEFVHLLHRYKLLEFDNTGKTTLLFGTSTLIPEIKNNNIQTLTITSFSSGKEKILLKKDFFPEHENGILTKKETEVYKLITAGHSSKEIAKHLKITVNTVNTHRKHIVKKLKTTKINICQSQFF